MIINQMMKGRSWACALVLLMAGGLLLGGCESDSVTPNDDVPELTELQAAQVAGRIASGIAKVGPELLKFDGPKSGNKVLGVYPYEFPSGGDITGTIVLEYFEGGAGGTHSNWDDADYGLIYTPGSTVVTAAIDLGGTEALLFEISFNLHGDINQTADTAAVLGGGTLAIGSFINSFSIPDDEPVVLSGVSSYPHGGMVIVNVDGVDLLVIYDGDHTAGVSVGGVISYLIDLDNGEVTPVS